MSDLQKASELSRVYTENVGRNEEVHFIGANGLAYVIVTRYTKTSLGKPVRVYECLHVRPTDEDDSFYMAAALWYFRQKDMEKDT